jgi:hypothetical protein
MKSNSTKLSLKNINFLVEQLLQEQVFGNLAYVYHGSNAPPNVMLDLIKNKKFDPGGGGGAMYGPGFYTIREFKPNSNTFGGEYGEYVYKFKANLAGVVSFDSDVTQQIYGKGMSIKDQIKLIINKNLVGPGSIQKLKEFLKSNQNHHLDKLNYDFDFSSNAAYKNWESLVSVVRGISFTGANDGPVVVFYSLDGIIPVAWSKTGEETQKDFAWNQFGVDSQKQNYDYEPFDQIKNNFLLNTLNNISKDLKDNFDKPVQNKIIGVLKNIFKNENYKNFEYGKKRMYYFIHQIIWNPNCPPDILKIIISNILEKNISDDYGDLIKTAISNPNCPPGLLRRLSRDPDPTVSSAALEAMKKRGIQLESLHRRIKMLLRETL